MNRNEKLKTLQDALQGKASQLEQLHQQRRKDAMPYVNATGFITVDCCPAEWSGFTVLDGEAAIDDDTRPRQCTFAEWRLLPVIHRSDCGLLIDARNDAFDTLPLAGMLLELRPYTRRYTYGGTIGDLRRCYNQSAESVGRSGILISVSYHIPPYLPNQPPPNESSRASYADTLARSDCHFVTASAKETPQVSPITASSIKCRWANPASMPNCIEWELYSFYRLKIHEANRKNTRPTIGVCRQYARPKTV